jgi:hypothetical protein
VPKKKRQQPREVRSDSSTPTKTWVRWSAIIVILALLFSIMLAAITSAPSSAATPAQSPGICKPIDTDSDGTINNADSDIDGDGIVNGRDEDIDGDGFVNSKDNDPAATNCEKSTTPPTLNDDLTLDGESKSSGIEWQWIVGVVAIGFGYLTLRQVRRRK